MCGIIGYIGPRETVKVLIEGLRRLEYRGYDSAGIAVFQKGKIEIRRKVGKLTNLERLIEAETFDGKVGIGHTRWATHGRPSDENAHPHKAGKVTVVHNGIIENYLPLREFLKTKGHLFSSETDTETIAHLIDEFIREGHSFLDAVKITLGKIKGSYALGILYEGDETCLIGARNEAPLVIGLGEEEYFIASDIPPILPYTRNFIFMEDGEVAFLSSKGVTVYDARGEEVSKEPKHVNWNPLMAEKSGYKHFMLKEIFEQPRALTDTIRGRLSEEKEDVILDNVRLDRETLKKIHRIILIACGTSYHAALVGKFLIEDFCRIPVEADIGSEFRYRNPIIRENDLIVAISQSGETADTLAALKEGKRKGAKTLSICNVVESSLARDSDHVIYTHAGPEIGVASTKTFVTQLITLFLLALRIGRGTGHLSNKEGKALVEEVVKLPHLMEEMLKSSMQVAQIARKYLYARDFLYLGRGINYPIALEGALKLKEISYIHAEGYPAGEMKHGPIALIDREMPVVVLATQNEVYEKVVSNIEEVRAREGRLIALLSQSDQAIAKKVDDVIFIPEALPSLTPILLTIPLQLLAYYMADFKGLDVDQPRNLAKSVTVE
ncbi:MAG TPA: glutamine--fructose-6-phosphate transaminase (isomerizing) [Thermodesulfobacteriota bacterium]|nr:glutamine--fructose-6-phosphate transaminase (isomerizing) [Thermodesulfobacteriota bacterium]